MRSKAEAKHCWYCALARREYTEKEREEMKVKGWESTIHPAFPVMTTLSLAFLELYIVVHNAWTNLQERPVGLTRFYELSNWEARQMISEDLCQPAHRNGVGIAERMQNRKAPAERGHTPTIIITTASKNHSSYQRTKVLRLMVIEQNNPSALPSLIIRLPLGPTFGCFGGGLVLYVTISSLSSI